ncbi:acyltransferase family protein [Sphingomonas sp. BIUV-7]|uniref:Acyltransferase family protein n=1 Tax=Sphingomonas natans TaxID=3063330 RepID=A0ABT8Y409_9SPHN|nr:acyltransferase family protein [Sphingomonas sp. BIUV-7]MDO6413057.1 acyltransferase family protein [Sphingomonas sp. BIUV-7]
MPQIAPAPDPAASSATALQGERHYGMDWLRIGAFQLLILYHIGMVFVPWEWHVSADEAVPWAVLPMVAINAWRLTLLFTVSGFASAAMLARRPALPPFVRNRVLRLGIPLLFGMIVVTPIQPWIQLTTQRGYGHGFGYFYLHDYYRFAMFRGMPLPAWQHLWFVFYLLVYTLLLAALRMLPPGVRARLRRGVERILWGPLLLLLPIAIGIVVRLEWMSAAEDNHNFLGDWVAHIRHFPAFLFGYLLYASPNFWRTLRRGWPLIAAVALASTVLEVWIAWDYPMTRPITSSMRALYQAARVVQGWSAILALIGIADHYWNRDLPWRATLVEAVFPFYIIHQTIIILVGWLLLGSGITNGLRLLVLIATTMIGCWLFYLVGRRIPALRPLIGLRPITTGKADP